MNLMRFICATMAMILTVTATAFTGFAEGVFSISTALDSREPVKSCTVSVISGGVAELSAPELERRIGLTPGSMSGITFTAVPDISHGAFYVDGVMVEAFEYFTRAELDSLCFAASEDISSATATLIPNMGDTVTVSLTIISSGSIKEPPVIEAASFSAIKNSVIRGFINVTDTEEDTVRIQVIKAPLKGDISFIGQSFLYEPFMNMTGRDSFTICAVDSYGNYSSEELIEISIEDSRENFAYADMRGSASLYAAVKLREKGVVTGKMVGGEWFFEPDESVSRGEFIVMLLASMGIFPGPAVNTGLPNDASIPLWLKPYVKKAVELGIISGSQAFAYNEIPIRAEAVLMTDRAANISDVKDFPLTMPDRESIPEWAIPSYTDLAAYKMLDLHDGNAYPTRALTNSYAADLIWQLYKHTHR